MKLQLHQPAPLFSLKDVFDRQINLEDYRNQGKKILISFFRNVACPFCNFRIHQLTKKNELWKDRLSMIFFIESKKEVVLRSSFHKDVSPIPMISDPERVIYQKYGVEKSFIKPFTTFFSSANRVTFQTAKEMGLKIDSGERDSQGVPADFILDENLRIIDLFYGKDIANHIPFERIDAVL